MAKWCSGRSWLSRWPMLVLVMHADEQTSLNRPPGVTTGRFGGIFKVVSAPHVEELQGLSKSEILRAFPAHVSTLTCSTSSPGSTPSYRR